MTGAMYSAIAGLRTHMTALNVIGNNISNVNTVGYKSSRYTFNEALYTMSRSGSNGTNTLGGRNPAQVGYGCNIGTIDLNVSTATYSPTGRALDCMIDGDGFFIVGDKGEPLGGDGTKSNPFVTASGITTQNKLQGMDLTRVGNFDFKDGFLVDGEGNVVYGFLTVEDAAEEGGEGEVTTRVSNVLTGIRLPMVEKVEQTMEDDDGNETTVVTYVFHFPVEDAETGLVRDQQVGLGEDADEETEKYERLSPDTVAIDNTGKITAITSDGETITVGYIAIGKVDSPNGVTHTNGRFYKAMDGAGYLRLTTIGGAVTYVPDPENQEEGSIFSELTIEDAGGTTMWTSGLESSNTDLATEISNMIVIQRGYQANTRIVTVTDSMLEELVNLKR